MSHPIYMVRTHTEERCLCMNKVACAKVRSEVGRKFQKVEGSILGDWSPNLTSWGLLWFLRLHHANKSPTRAPPWRCWAKNNLESSIALYLWCGMDLGQETRNLIHDMPFSGCAASMKFFHLFKPQFAHQQKGTILIPQGAAVATKWRDIPERTL